MRRRFFGPFFAGGALAALSPQQGHAQQNASPLVRIAELEIHPQHLADYKLALREEIEASLRLEPGVLTLHAVALAETPHQIRIFETYASRTAYDSHIKSAHFLKYKTATQHMVKSLKLIDATLLR